MSKKKPSDLIGSVLRGLVLCVLGFLLFGAGFHNFIQNHKDHASHNINIAGGLIFICLGLFVFILGCLVIYCTFSPKLDDDELDTNSEKVWFIIFMVGMGFLSLSGLLTIVWGMISMINSSLDASIVVNMLIVMLVGLFIFTFPIGLLVLLVPSVFSPSLISPVTAPVEDRKFPLP